VQAKDFKKQDALRNPLQNRKRTEKLDMMGAISILTSLKDAGIEPKQAEAIFDAIEQSKGELVTKQDLTVTESKLEAKISDLRAELKSEIGDLRAELKSEIGDLRAELKSEIGDLRAELKSEIGNAKLFVVWPFILVIVTQIVSQILPLFRK
jgi:hypothetical protein